MHNSERQSSGESCSHLDPVSKPHSIVDGCRGICLTVFLSGIITTSGIVISPEHRETILRELAESYMEFYKGRKGQEKPSKTRKSTNTIPAGQSEFIKYIREQKINIPQKHKQPKVNKPIQHRPRSRTEIT